MERYFEEEEEEELMVVVVRDLRGIGRLNIVLRSSRERVNEGSGFGEAMVAILLMLLEVESVRYAGAGTKGAGIIR